MKSSASASKTLHRPLISSGNLGVPKATTEPTYDAAGNLANDDRWVYEWDSTNRLRKMTTTPEAISGGFPNQTIEFVYDWQGHRISKKVTSGSTTISDHRYLYEGWNVVAEWTVVGGSLLVPQTHLWGLDLVGQSTGDVAQLQGAGGVGGLKAVDVRKVSDASSLGVIYPSYDGNGNILAWSGTDGLVKRTQDYDAFGNTVLKHTDSATGNPLGSGNGEMDYGFSTKPEDRETGLLYYGYRYYDPITGRWPSRDPIDERGGLNLYGFLSKRSVDYFDVLGLQGKKWVILESD